MACAVVSTVGWRESAAVNLTVVRVRCRTRQLRPPDRRKLPYGSMDRKPARSYRTRAASSKARRGELQFRLWARLKSFDQLLVSRNDDLSVSTTTGFQLVSAIYEVDNWRESF
jgi:hypothetical protein